MILQFGAHKGTDIADVPDSYIFWGKDNFSGPTRKIFEDEATRRAGLSVTTKLSRGQFGEELATLLLKVPEGLQDQKFTYNGYEVSIRKVT